MNIILGITGSVSAYKTPWLVRDLRRAGHDVRVVMTPSATRFVTPLALEAVSTHAVVADMFDPSIQEGGSWHVHLAQWADVMLIAPCSATTLARLASGASDTAVQLTAFSLPKDTPLFVAPAMDTDMWHHPATQRNVDRIRTDGAIVIPPATGALASGLQGEGRLPELDDLVRIVASHELSSTSDPTTTIPEPDAAHLSGAGALTGRTVLITAGPTHEAIDDVRFIGNHSSGKMGFALAEAARDRGALVTLVTGPVSLPSPTGITCLRVTSAQEMYDACMQQPFDVAICAAAVADFAPAARIEGKMKKDEVTDAAGNLTLHLQRTPDILQSLGERKRDGQIVVGFALEHDNVIDYARAKLVRKHCDMIVANKAGGERSGFGVSDNTITIITGKGDVTDYPPMSKRACAEVILDHIDPSA